MARMPRLLLDKPTSLLVAGEALQLDSVAVEESSSPTMTVAEEDGEVGSVGGSRIFYDSSALIGLRSPPLLSGLRRVECIWGFLGRVFVTSSILAWSCWRAAFLTRA
jgi:hypothetical protein